MFCVCYSELGWLIHYLGTVCIEFPHNSIVYFENNCNPVRTSCIQSQMVVSCLSKTWSANNCTPLLGQAKQFTTPHRTYSLRGHDWPAFCDKPAPALACYHFRPTRKNPCQKMSEPAMNDVGSHWTSITAPVNPIESSST